MFEAIHKYLKKRYTILDFEELSEGEKSKIKGNLVCPECGKDAYYRARSRDGKRATFAAKHIEGCPESKSTKGKVGDKEIEVSKSNVDSNVIQIDFNVGGSLGSNGNKIASTNTEKTGENNVTRKHVINPAIKKPLKLNMKQILTALLNDSDFENKRIIIPSSKKELLGKDAFIHSSKIEKREFEDKRFFWGTIATINQSDDTIWINSSEDINGFSILIDTKCTEKFLEQYNIDNKSFNQNNVFLAYGQLRFSMKSDKPFMVISNLDYLTIGEKNN